MNDIKLMTDLIEKEAQEKAALIKVAAEQEARRISKEGRIQIQKKRNSIMDEYKRRSDEIEARARAEISAKFGQMQLAARQALIEETISSARELFSRRDEKEDTELLLRVFKSSVANADGESPVVLVPRDRLLAAQAALGQETAVEAADIEHGFILSFRYYNVNYETNARFEFLREELEELAALCLFDGDGNGEA